METKNSTEERTRMIHVRLPETVHKKVRIRVAEADQTIQDWVLQAIQNNLESVESGGSVCKVKT
ncbi:MAG: hypothetical protein PHQ43_04210 [Dehalococcoidales bacterium]|nr:hypothetical protein [Dehalococcoidales bacterium]